MELTNQLGDFLRTQRELVLPSDVGIPEEGRRRVHGLRREEAASLSNISPDRYFRIEQGLEQIPPDDVLAKISRAFRLDETALAELNRIRHSVAVGSGTAPINESDPPEPSSINLENSVTGYPPARPADTPVSAGQHRVSNSLEALVQSWPDQAAFIQGPLCDILSSNSLAAALSPIFSAGTNFLRAVFLDPSARTIHRDWNATLCSAVAQLRSIATPDTNDAGIERLIGQLAMRSPEFRTLWAQPAVPLVPVSLLQLQHPQVGPLDLRVETLTVGGSPEQQLVILHAEPGSESETAFRRLAAIATGGGSGFDAGRPLAVPVSIESKRRLP